MKSNNNKKKTISEKTIMIWTENKKIIFLIKNLNFLLTHFFFISTKMFFFI